MGDWQRAGLLPELALSLIKASQLSTAGAPSGKGGGGSYDSLPPEPTLRDLASLGSLQEKFSLLEDTVTHLKEELQIKDSEISNLHLEFENKNKASAELSVKLASIEEKLSMVDDLKTTLDGALEAEKAVEGTVEGQGQTLEDIRGAVDNLKGAVDGLKGEMGKIDKITEDLKDLDKFQEEILEIEKLKQHEMEEIEHLKKEVKQIEMKTGSAGALGVTPLKSDDPPSAGAGDLPSPSVMPPGGEQSPADLDPPAGLTPPPGMEPPAASTTIDTSPSMTPPGMDAPPVIGGDLGGSPPSADLSSPIGDAAAAPADAGTQGTASPPKKSKKGLIIVVGLVLLGLGGAFFMGLIPMGGTPEGTADIPPPIPTEPSPAPPAEPDPEPAAMAAALSAVKGWHPAAGVEPIADFLRTAAGMTPWKTEAGKDGAVRVSYFGTSPWSKGPPSNILFDFNAAAGSVMPANAAATSFMDAMKKNAAGKAKRAAKKRPRRRRVKIKPKTSMDSLFDEVDDSEPVRPARRSRSRPRSRAPEADVDALFDDIESVKPRGSAGPRKRGRRSRKSKPASQMSLDDLLDLDDSPLEEPQAVSAKPSRRRARPIAKSKAAPAPAVSDDAADEEDDDELLDDLLSP